MLQGEGLRQSILEHSGLALFCCSSAFGILNVGENVFSNWKISLASVYRVYGAYVMLHVACWLRHKSCAPAD